MSDVKKAREALYDLMSEEALLSHAISNPKILIEAKSVIDTMTGERKVLAEAIFDLASNNEPISDDALRVHGSDEKVRGLFAKLAPLTPKVTAGKVLDLLRSIAARREVATGASAAFSGATEGSGAAVGIISELESVASRARFLLQGHQTSGGISHISNQNELIEDITWRAKNPGKIRGIRFGFPRLEELLDGLQGSKLYLIGARPGVGKTALAGDIAVNLAIAGIGTAFFSCEMSKLQLQQRLLATLTGVNPRKSMKGALIRSELEKITAGLKTMKDWPVWIDDTDRIDIDLLRSRARRAVSKDGVKCIIVDYIQLVRGVEPKSRQSKREEVGEVSGALKALSKELNVPVIALAQLKRTGNAYNSSSSMTEIPRPNLESLKESGDLEQDADAVVLLHRDPSQNASNADAIVAKNRSGGNGEAKLDFANDTTSFSESRDQYV